MLINPCQAEDSVQGLPGPNTIVESDLGSSMADRRLEGTPKQGRAEASS